MRNRIAILIGSLSGGGAERVVCNLANYLKKHGHDIDIITMSDVEDAYQLDRGINRVCLLHMTERRGKISDYLLRRKRLKEFLVENCDISCYITMLPFTIFMLIRLRKFTNGKIIISERCNPSSYGFLKRRMMKYAVKRCDGLVVQTDEIARWYGNRKNMIVIPNAHNDDNGIKRERSEKRIVAVGRLCKQKNYPLLIDAFSSVVVNYPDFVLEIYGKGNLEKALRKRVYRLGISDKVVFKGYSKNVLSDIRNASLFVLSSNFEGIPNVLIEAMCLGLPCVATDCDGGGARSLIDNGKNGILIHKNDKKELCDAIVKIIENKSFATELSKNASGLKNTLSSGLIYGKWESFIIKEIKDRNGLRK